MISSFAPELLMATLGISFVSGILIGLLGFIVAFGLAVFIHELGHFLAAKAFGVPVERFVIGFDKEAMPFLPGCIWERKIGETTYGLSLVPLGGYVKMSGVVHPEIEKYLDGDGAKSTAGEKPLPSQATRPDGIAPAATKSNTLQGQAMQDMNALYKKPFWQKIIIYGAGVVMNMILAMAAVTFLFAKGHEADAPFETRVGWLKEGNTFAAMGIQTGDILLAVNGTSVKNSEDLGDFLVERIQARDENPEGLAFQLTIGREGIEPFTMDVDLSTDERLVPEFYSTFVYTPAFVDYVIINHAADRAGIKAGDLVIVIDEEPVLDWGHFVSIVRASAGKELNVTLRRAGESIQTPMTPRENPEEPGIGQVGIVVGNSEKILHQEALLVAAMASPGRVFDFSKRYVEQLGRLGKRAAEGNVAAVRQNLGGPVGIAQMAYRHAQQGFDQWLRFLILLNVALAVMNILPFPVLDGGHICFAIYEAIFRKPVPPRVLVPLLNAAVIFILVFFVLVTFNDVLKIFT